MAPICCPNTSLKNYHTTPCNNPEDHRFHQHRGGSLKSRAVAVYLNYATLPSQKGLYNIKTFEMLILKEQIQNKQAYDVLNDCVLPQVVLKFS
jgi:hypothetical protein